MPIREGHFFLPPHFPKGCHESYCKILSYNEENYQSKIIEIQIGELWQENSTKEKTKVVNSES